MSISTKVAETLLWLYKKTNRLGLMDSRFIRSVYISTYFTYKKYLEDSYARLAKYYPDLFKGGHILDIGANIGYTSFVFSKAIQDSFKIFAFEPEKRNVETLAYVSHKYGFSKRLVPIANAVGDRDGEIELWKNEGNNSDHRILTEELKKQLTGIIQTQKTPLISIDSYLKSLGNSLPISFIKIDVQGYEHAVCKGMTETLAHNPNAVISFEYSPSVIETLGFKPDDLLHFFQERGYNFFFLNSKNIIEKYDIEQSKLSLQKIKPPYDYVDILCTRKNLIDAINPI